MEMGVGLHIDAFSLYNRGSRFNPAMHNRVRTAVRENSGSALAVIHPNFLARHALSEKIGHNIGYGRDAEEYNDFRQTMAAFLQAYNGPIFLFVENIRMGEMELWLDFWGIQTPAVLVNTVKANPTPVIPCEIDADHGFRLDPWEAIRDTISGLDVEQLEIVGELAYFTSGIPRGCVHIAFQELQGSHRSSRLSIINNRRDSWRPAIKRAQQCQGDRFLLKVLQELTFPNTERD